MRGPLANPPPAPTGCWGRLGTRQGRSTNIPLVLPLRASFLIFLQLPAMNSSLTIIGGGITGLAAAYLASQAGYTVRVVEAQAEMGGLLRTFSPGGAPLEHFYHHFFTHDAEIHWLVEQLGLQDKLTYHETSMGIFRGGRIYPFDGIGDLLRFQPLGLMDKLRFGLTSLYLGRKSDWRSAEDVPTLDWMRRWAGKGVAQHIWGPLMKAKFGPYAEKVPLAWMIGRLGQRLNSRQSGREQLGYLQGSLQVLLDALLEALNRQGVELITGQAVRGVQIEEDQLKGIDTTDHHFKGGRFLFTIPQLYLIPFLQDQAPQLASALSQVEYFHAACTILALDRPLSHIYWLNIADENLPFGGIIEHTNFISPAHYQDQHLVYLSRYYAPQEPFAQQTASEIKDSMIEGLYKVYPKFNKNWIRKSWIFQTRTAATVCDLNFSDKVPSCRSHIENMYIANMSHIYPDERSTNNAIRVAAEACKAMGLEIADVPRNQSLSGQIGFAR
ncbi:MAG: NAD(P)/FAD-dependent oxidoreductase [Bacteroidota bacterium]